MRSQACTAGFTVELAALLLSCGALTAQTDSAQEREELFQRIKAHVSEHLARLPNYTCHETLDRMIRVRSTWRHVDTVNLEVVFAGRQELFAPAGSNRFGDQPIEQIVQGGTVGDVAMGSHIDLIFSRNVADFEYAGTANKEGHKTLRYNLRVPIERSGFRVRHNGSQAMAGYEGSVWVDAETFDLVRVDFKVNQIPSFVGVRLIEESMHYKKLTIGKSEFDLPDHSELGATDEMGNYSLNRIKLDGCREYGAESIVTYGPPSEWKAPGERQDH